MAIGKDIHCEKSACYKINTQFCTVEGKRVDPKIKGVVSCSHVSSGSVAHDGDFHSCRGMVIGMELNVHLFSSWLSHRINRVSLFLSGHMLELLGERLVECPWRL